MRLGWRVVVIWECALRNDANLSLAHLEEFIRGGEEFIEIQTGS
jgi:G:T-mismatch repair DNA endonuclease (very short patch repair protein)